MIKSNIINRRTWITAAVFGAVIALSGIMHGFFEILQGNTAAEFNIIQSIGVDQQRWPNGQEAFTLIPNFLITGITAIITSLFIIYWSIKHLHTFYGPTIFIIVYVFLTLVGGGIIHILFFIPIYIYARRIRMAISWRGKQPGEKFSGTLSRLWMPMLVLTSLLFLVALAVSFYGLPGTPEKTIYTVIYMSLILALVTLILTFLAAFIFDIREGSTLDQKAVVVQDRPA